MADAPKPNMPTDEQLIAFAAGELPAAQDQAIAAAVKGDPRAAALVAAYQSIRDTVQGDDGVAPPQSAVDRARAIFRSRAVSAASAPGVLATWIDAVDRFIATIIYDSRLQPAAVRFVDPSAGDRINLTFETQTGEVDLQAERAVEPHGRQTSEAGGRWRIMGQISEASPGARRELALVDRDSQAQPLHTITDDHGSFTINAPAGRYELLLRDGDRVLVLTPIELK